MALITTTLKNEKVNTVNIRLKTMSSLIIIALMLTGCWKQNDTISIQTDGTVSFQTDVEIPSNATDPMEVKDRVAHFLTLLEENGWKIDMHWISEPNTKDLISKPSTSYRLTIKGQGNIRTIKSTPNQYYIKQFSANTYSIYFLASDSKSMEKISRTIKLVSDGVKIIDEKNNVLNMTSGGISIVPEKTYQVVFQPLKNK